MLVLTVLRVPISVEVAAQDTSVTRRSGAEPPPACVLTARTVTPTQSATGAALFATSARYGKHLFTSLRVMCYITTTL